MTTVRQYGNQAEAYIDRGFLQANGIPAQVECDSISELFPGPGASAGSIKLIVPDECAREALQLLDSRD